MGTVKAALFSLFDAMNISFYTCTERCFSAQDYRIRAKVPRRKEGEMDSREPLGQGENRFGKRGQQIQQSLLYLTNKKYVNHT